MAKLKAKTLQQILNTRKLTTSAAIQDFMMGKSVRVISNNSRTIGRHNYTIGEVLTFNENTSVPSYTYAQGFMTSNGYPGNAIAFTDMELLEDSAEIIEKEVKRVNAQIKSLEKIKTSLANKLAYLTDTGKTTVVEEEYFGYQVAKLANAKLTPAELTKELLALVGE